MRADGFLDCIHCFFYFSGEVLDYAAAVEIAGLELTEEVPRLMSDFKGNRAYIFGHFFGGDDGHNRCIG